MLLALMFSTALQTAAVQEIRFVTTTDPGRARTGLAQLEWEILSGFARLSNLKLVRIDAPSSTAAARAVGERSADLLSVTERTTELAVTEDVVPTRFVVVNRRPGAAFGYVEELRGRKVVAAGGLAAQVASDAKIHATGVADGAAALSALAAGEIDAAIVDMYEALQLQASDPAVQLGAFVGPRQAVRFALRTNDTRLAALNAYLRQLRSSTTWGMLIARHLGPGGMEALGRARLSVR